MIQCIEIYKTFGAAPIIRDINLEIQNGKITSLIGKNGAGKSTLIGLIMGYYNIDSGSIIHESISVMPDADNVYLDWTGEEFLKFISKIKKIDLTHTLSIADELGITKNLKNKISGYSFGMKKKLSFIQCAAGSYDTYIFDEPTSGVDAPSALIMLDIIERLKNNGAGILLTSHNIDELERVSDYVYIIEHGQITNNGTVDKLINDNNKEQIYILNSLDSKKILNDDTLPFKKRIIDSTHLEIVLDDKTTSTNILKAIISEYSVLEFYKKKQTLIESVYKSDY